MTTELDDTLLLSQFESRTLPATSWTHRAHLRVACIYLQIAPVAEVIGTLRQRIRAYNETVGTPNTPTRGYHETITCAWALVLASIVHQQEATGLSSQDILEHHPELLGKDYLQQYYSPELLKSTEARATFILPDRLPLPEQEALIPAKTCCRVDHHSSVPCHRI